MIAVLAVWFVGVAGLLAVGAVSLYGVGSERGSPPGTAFEAGYDAAAGSPATDLPDGTLRVAVAPVVSPEASLGLYQALIDYVGDRLGRRGVLLQRSSYAEIDALLRVQKADVAFICTYAYVLGKRDFGLEALAIPMVRGAVRYRSYVVVRAASPFRSLLDLRGLRLASADVLSNTGWLYPAYVLASAGESIDGFFSDINFAGGHDRALRAVVEGYADVAGVDHLVYEQMVAAEPALATTTRIIDRSPPFGMPPVVVNPALDPALKAELREVLVHMHQTPGGRAALGPLGIDRFFPPVEADYDPIRRMIELIGTER